MHKIEAKIPLFEMYFITYDVINVERWCCEVIKFVLLFIKF